MVVHVSFQFTLRNFLNSFFVLSLTQLSKIVLVGFHELVYFSIFFFFLLWSDRIRMLFQFSYFVETCFVCLLCIQFWRKVLDGKKHYVSFSVWVECFIGAVRSI